MRVRLLYGKTGIDVDLPDSLDPEIVEPRYVRGLPDPAGALRSALRNPIGSAPLASLVRPGATVGIVFNDITRATPSEAIIEAVLSELSATPPENVTLFNATGTHRANTEAELRGMLGDRLVDGYRIVQNDAADAESHRSVGTTSRGNGIRIHRELAACDVKILTGFIEPHFFAGFSGGGKAVMPGMAALETVKRNHDAANIDAVTATWGVTSGNPLWEEVHEAASMLDGIFLTNVALNRDKEITAVFAGDLTEAHSAGCGYVREHAMAPVDSPFDIVVTSNAGYPLDLNLYQSVKGMSAAARIVTEGGAIVIAADCWDGIPDHGSYGRLLRAAGSVDELLDLVRGAERDAPDRWQAHVHALVRRKADVYFHSRGLTDGQIVSAHLSPCADIGETVSALAREYGPGVRICVLPEGPLTMPYLR